MSDNLTTAEITATQENESDQHDLGELVLRIASNPRNGQLVRLTERKCTIGSASGCTLRLRSPNVHASHCIVIRGEQQTMLRSLASDTRLNGRAFTAEPINVGDMFSVGPVDFEVLSLDAQRDDSFDNTIERGQAGNVTQTDSEQAGNGNSIAPEGHAELLETVESLQRSRHSIKARTRRLVCDLREARDLIIQQQDQLIEQASQLEQHESRTEAFEERLEYLENMLAELQFREMPDGLFQGNVKTDSTEVLNGGKMDLSRTTPIHSDTSPMAADAKRKPEAQQLTTSESTCETSATDIGGDVAEDINEPTQIQETPPSVESASESEEVTSALRSDSIDETVSSSNGLELEDVADDHGTAECVQNDTHENNFAGDPEQEESLDAHQDTSSDTEQIETEQAETSSGPTPDGIADIIVSIDDALSADESIDDSSQVSNDHLTEQLTPELAEELHVPYDPSGLNMKESESNGDVGGDESNQSEPAEDESAALQADLAGLLQHARSDKETSDQSLSDETFDQKRPQSDSSQFVAPTESEESADVACALESDDHQLQSESEGEQDTPTLVAEANAELTSMLLSEEEPVSQEEVADLGDGQNMTQPLQASIADAFQDALEPTSIESSCESALSNDVEGTAQSNSVAPEASASEVELWSVENAPTEHTDSSLESDSDSNPETNEADIQNVAIEGQMEQKPTGTEPGMATDEEYYDDEYDDESAEDLDFSAMQSGGGSEDEEESIEEYMAKLLKRVRGESSDEESDDQESLIKPPESIRDPEVKPKAEKKKPVDDGKLLEKAFATEIDARQKEFAPAKLPRRTEATEGRDDLAAMRELANKSARNAIQEHTQRRETQLAYLQLGGAVVAVLLGAAMMGMSDSILSFIFFGALGLWGIAGILAYRCFSWYRSNILKQGQLPQANGASNAGVPQDEDVIGQEGTLAKPPEGLNLGSVVQQVTSKVDNLLSSMKKTKSPDSPEDLRNLEDDNQSLHSQAVDTNHEE